MMFNPLKLPLFGIPNTLKIDITTSNSIKDNENKQEEDKLSQLSEAGSDEYRESELRVFK